MALDNEMERLLLECVCVCTLTPLLKFTSFDDQIDQNYSIYRNLA